MPPDRHQTPANKGKRTQAIEHSQFSYSVQDDHRGTSEIRCLYLGTLRATHRLAVVGLDMTQHSCHPFQMSRRQHQEEVRVVLIQLAIDGQQDGFFPLMGTTSHEETPAYHQR